jgi:integrase
VATLEAYVYPVIGKKPVGVIDNRYVLDVLEQDVPAVTAADGRELRRGGKLWEARPDTATRVRGRIKAVLDWARFNGYRQGDNPARWRGNLDFALTKVNKANHHAALPFDQIATFIRELQGRDGIAPLALEFLILTAARTSEVLAALTALRKPGERIRGSTAAAGRAGCARKAS